MSESRFHADGGFSAPGDATYAMATGAQSPEVQLPLVTGEVTAIAKRNILNQAQTFRLITYLMGKIADLEGQPDKDVAEMASKELGFTVAENNVSGIRLNQELPELTWNPSRVRIPKSSDTPDCVPVEDFKLLVTSYLQLLQQLELTPQTNLVEMAKKYF